MKATRLQLKKVNFGTNSETGRSQASVQLNLAAREFIGHYQASSDESPMRAIALATFAATNEALLASIGSVIEINLRVAEELRPIFMNKSLFIVIVDAKIGKFSLKPTGAVVANHEDCYRATAAASLDSINRLVQNLLKMSGY